MARAETTKNLSSLERLNFELNYPPYHAFLRPEAMSADSTEGCVEIRLPFRANFQRVPDSPEYHGGVIAGLIDLTAHAAVAVKIGRMAPTVDLRIDYMRPATGDLLARGVVRRAGRTLAVSDVEVSDANGKIIALGRGTFSTIAC